MGTLVGLLDGVLGSHGINKHDELEAVHVMPMIESMK